MSLSPGAILGPYEIVAIAGSGGMGEVYRAKDTRLGRTVAIKILPSHLSGNPDLKERLEREARTISSLSHPHICALYDIGQQNSTDYLVMEFLDGETLAEKLIKGPLPMEQVLRYGMQISDALDKAHRQGIIHRDLKPGNIMLTKTGVKLLDFGLAKLQTTGQSISGVSAFPTEQRSLTAEGNIIGTLQYMSPEQLEGKQIDARTDIFAMGVVLYEMATGRKAFTGKSQASLIASILSSEPVPISTIQPLAPPAFDRVVKTCLAKDPEDRWQTAHDTMLELKWIAEGGSQAGVAAPVLKHRKNRERFAWTAAGLFLLSTILLAFVVLNTKPHSAPAVRLHINPPENTSFTASLALSPDGRHLAFTAQDADGTTSLWVRPLNSLSARRLPGTEDARFPFWSRNGRSIGFFDRSKLKKIEIAGGPPVDLADASWDSRGGTWNHADEILFSPNFQGPIHRISAGGGKAEPATVLNKDRQEQSHRWPVFLPDGRHFFYLVLGGKGETGSVFVGSLDGGEPKFLLKVNSVATFAPPDRILFHREQTLMQQRFDIQKFVLKGSAAPIANEIAVNPDLAGFAAFSVSENGILSYRSEKNPIARLVWIDRSGHELQTLGKPAHFLHPEISQDNRRIAVGQQDMQTHNGDIWQFDMSRGLPSRLTFDAADEFRPIWSPDGKQLLFASDRGGVVNIYQKDMQGTAEDRLLLKSDVFNAPSDWSADGRFILCAKLDPISKFDLWILPLYGDRKEFPFLATVANEWNGQFSPDMRWIAYNSNQSGKAEVYIRPFPGPGPEIQLSVNGGRMPRWRKDGKELFYLASNGKMTAVTLNGDSPTDVSAPVTLFDANFVDTPEMQYDVSVDGQRFLIPRILETDKAGPVTIVLNWFAEIKD